MFPTPARFPRASLAGAALRRDGNPPHPHRAVKPLLPLRIACVAFAATAFASTAFATNLSFRVTDQKNTPVADAVVSLVPLDAPTDASSPASAVAAPTPVEITQEEQEFQPYVTAVRVGTPITFPNRDTVQHHVYSVSKPKNFELPLYMPGKAETVVFDEPGAVVIGCNIHDWMSAHVLVLETPFFAKTDPAGNAMIAHAPPGRYRAEVWHPRLARIATREIALGETAPDPLAFTLTLRPDRRIRRAPQMKGGGYR